MSNGSQSIPIKLHAQTPLSWQFLLSDCKISTAELLKRVGLEHHTFAIDDAELNFALRTPQPYLDKIKHGDPNDPLLLQVLPQSAELLERSDFVNEPLQEQEFTPVPGLIHKYTSRVLLITTQACAIHCRYCFRRNFPYSEHQQSRKDWQQAFDYIAKQPEVNEVILSGGDPLSLSDNYLSELMTRLASIKNIERIRIHTRLLPALPQRISKEFIKVLEGIDKEVIIVAHCNHPNELGDDTKYAFEQLKLAKVTLLNQSVLLKNINDNADTLCELSEKLFSQGVLPYYLFTLDKVAGASHFDLPIEQALIIYEQLTTKLPGFLIPKLAKEEPGKASKTVLSASGA